MKKKKTLAETYKEELSVSGFGGTCGVAAIELNKKKFGGKKRRF